MSLYIPSVTEVIGFCNSRAFDNVPAHLLQAAADRGTLVHGESAMTLEGVWFDADPAVAGFLKSLTNWKNEYVEKVIAVEPELVAPKLRVKGHPDAIVQLKGDVGLAIGDWKTPKPLSKSWRLQLAGYKLIAEANGYKIVRVFSLRLDANGGLAKFQGYTKTLAHDTNVFLSCLNVWNFYNN